MFNTYHCTHTMQKKSFPLPTLLSGNAYFPVDRHCGIDYQQGIS